MKILHSADWHLGSPFSGFPPAQRQYLKEQLALIPEKTAALCRSQGCDLMLLAGDLLDSPENRSSCGLLARALENCGVPVFISPGNHDHLTPGSPWLAYPWPENVHIFTGRMESIALPQLDCRIYGAGYQSMDCPGLLEGFHANGPEKYHIALLHGDPTAPSSPYCPITAGQLRSSGLDYLALGHIHKAGTLRSGKTLAAWPGCPMGRGFDETGEKGVYITELGELAETAFFPLEGIRFHDLTADITGSPEAALEQLLPAGPSNDFFRITLTGSGSIDLPGLLGRYTHCPHLELVDRTLPEEDLWGCADGDSLEGAYFRLLREALESAGAEDAPRIRLAAGISRRLLRGEEVTLP